MCDRIECLIADLQTINHQLFGKDFLLTSEKSMDDLMGILHVVEILRAMQKENISTRVFDTGLGISQFRDNSTRTRFSFASAVNMLGLAMQDLDEAKSQISHGETVRETSVMISFLSEVIGIRDDMYIGMGNTYMREVGEALDESYTAGILPVRPSIVNLQCDIDHPTQSMSDLAHLIHYFGGVDELQGKKLAMTWAYSPSYGKPLSVPQGIITLLTRFGMDVTLAHPEGYDLLPDTIKQAKKFSKESGGKFEVVHSMDKAFENADVVYPKSWAPFSVMEERTKLVKSGKTKELGALEQKCLDNNKKFLKWECDAKKMKKTKGGEALYMHCLPADITGVSCKQGEVAADVFEKYRLETYAEASFKPYVIAAMILTSRFRDPAALLDGLVRNRKRRQSF